MSEANWVLAIIFFVIVVAAYVVFLAALHSTRHMKKMIFRKKYSKEDYE